MRYRLDMENRSYAVKMIDLVVNGGDTNKVINEAIQSMKQSMTGAQRDLFQRFTVEDTGGNCQALVLTTTIPNDLTDSTIIWITDGNLGIDFENMCDDCKVLVGWYPDEDAVYEGRALDTAEFVTIDQALDAINAWLSAHGE